MQALFVIAGIVAVVWGAIVFLRGGLLGGCLAVMLAGTCFSVPFLKVSFGAIPLSIDRILLLVLIAQYALWRRWGVVEAKPAGNAEFVLCALIGMMVLSTFRADYQRLGYQPVAWLILYYLMPFGVYWIARQAPLSERAATTLFGCLAAMAVYLAVTVVAEKYQLWWLLLPRYIATTAIRGEAEFIGRGRGPLLNPIGSGALLAVCTCGALMWWPRVGRHGRMLLVGLTLLCCLGLYCSLTRSVWLGGMIALAIVVGLALPSNRRIPVLGGGLLIVALLAAAQWEHIVRFKRDRYLTAEHTATSVSLRPLLAVVAWNMFCDRPLLGCGFNQYGVEHKYYLTDRSTGTPLEKARGYTPHNVLLSLLTESGLVGLGLFLTLVALWGRDAWRLWRTDSAPLWARQQGLLLLAAMSVYFTNGMFHDISVIPMGNMTLFFLAGIMAGLRPLLYPAAVAVPTTAG